MNIAKIVKGADGVDGLVAHLAELAEGLVVLGVDELLAQARRAEAAAEALRRCRQSIADAERAEAALRRFAVRAEHELGVVLGELAGGTPGQRHKSKRRETADALGLTRQETANLVQLGQLERDEVEDLAERLASKGRRVSVRGVLDEAKGSSSDSNGDEWYTPRVHVEAVHRVFGGPPDHDPASCAVGQLLVLARVFFTAALLILGEAERAAGITASELEKLRERWGGVGRVYDCETGELIEEDPAIESEARRRKSFAKRANGRGRISHAEQLAGKVFCNPPYSFPAPFIRAIIEGFIGRSLEQAWSEYAAELGRSADELDADEQLRATWRAAALGLAARRHGGRGRISEAIILVNAAVGTAIQQYLCAAASAQCLVAGRIAFRDPTGQPQSGNRYEQVIFYLGVDPRRFCAEYSRFGQLTRSVHPDVPAGTSDEVEETA